MIDLAGLCGAGYDMVRKVDKRGESAKRGNELSERGEKLSANVRNFRCRELVAEKSSQNSISRPWHRVLPRAGAQLIRAWSMWSPLPQERLCRTRSRAAGGTARV